MIIDLILDRKAGCLYDVNKAYKYIKEESEILGLDNDIVEAFEKADNALIQQALCKYIDTQGYNSEIKDYVNSVNWLTIDSEIEGELPEGVHSITIDELIKVLTDLKNSIGGDKEVLVAGDSEGNVVNTLFDNSYNLALNITTSDKYICIFPERQLQ